MERRRPPECIKIPGTPAGVPAVEEMLYEGVNINITLLFAIKDYEAVAQAYIRALERRAAEGQPLKDVASVASFFLSRIDVLVDQLLGHRIRPGATLGEEPRAEQRFGKAAVTNAKLAYQSFRRIFSGDRWRALEEQGARVQRPLWASTSTKDPLYDDVRYVEPLIGPHTVNTMPDETIAAFADHGVARENMVEEGLEEAYRTLRDLEGVGVDLDHVAWQLQNEGAQKFIDPYDALMKTLAVKRQRFLGAEASEQRMALGLDFAALLDRAQQMRVSCGPVIPAPAHPGISLGTLLGMAARHRRDKVTLVLDETVQAFGAWAEQLLAESKQNTLNLLSTWQRQGALGEGHPILESEGVAIYGDARRQEAWRPSTTSVPALLQAFVAQMKPPDYLALLPYLHRTPARHEILQALRVTLRNRFRVATTLGYGPRYLHSTGQLHKGGPNMGVFIVLTADAPEGIPIPGQPYGFATLQRAQAMGDFLALSRKQRRVIHIHLGGDVEGGLKRIAESLQ